MKATAAGDHKKAAEAFKRYLEAPLADLSLRAAAIEIAGGRLMSAAGSLQRYLAASPGDPVALRMLGQIAANIGSPKDAEQMFRSVLEVVPGYVPVRYELAACLLFQGMADIALAEAEALLRRDQANPSFLNLKAAALGKLGEIDAAIALYEQLLGKNRASPKLWIDYGNSLRAKRRSVEAIAAFRQATMLARESGEAWWNLANMKTGELSSGDLETMQAALTSGKATAVDRFHLHFAIARALEEHGDHEQALAEYREANRGRLAIGGALKGPTTTERVARMIKLFTPEFIASRADAGDPSTDPIFILGMPRSGSTLLEQILSSHPSIEGTQELPDLVSIARALDDEAGEGQPYGYPEAIGRLSHPEIRALGARYIAGARAQRKTDRPFFIDKQPANWLHVGLIQLILPRARIINIRRHALANCLSMFRQHFARGVMYSYAVDTLAAEYRAYDRLMTFFDEVSPQRIKEVRLEDLVDDLEGGVRKILDYLGLPFAPECLRFFESDRAVFTPSSEQVRRPINDDATIIFERFEPYLKDFRQALGETMSADDFTGSQSPWD